MNKIFNFMRFLKEVSLFSEEESEKCHFFIQVFTVLF
jgi:hypothetical protein